MGLNAVRIEDDAGVVRIDVLTPERRENFRVWPEPDRQMNDFYPEWWSDRQETFWIGAFGHRQVGWACVYLIVAVKGEGGYRRLLDLSTGADDRRFLTRLIGQERVVVRWVNEAQETTFLLPEMRRQYWREALENTQHFSPEDFRELYQEQRTKMKKSELPPFTPRFAGRKRRTATPSPDPDAIFAPRSGALPRTGRATVKGLKLPRGGRVPDYDPVCWATVDPVPNAAVLAEQLCDAFPDTGLWPLLWESDEDPGSCLTESADLDRIDTIDINAVMGAAWDRNAPNNPQAVKPFTTGFPGLASASPHRAQPSNPFRSYSPQSSARVLLVPCNRPADAVAVIGGRRIQALIATVVVRSLRSAS